MTKRFHTNKRAICMLLAASVLLGLLAYVPTGALSTAAVPSTIMHIQLQFEVVQGSGHLGVQDAEIILYRNGNAFRVISTDEHGMAYFESGTSRQAWLDGAVEYSASLYRADGFEFVSDEIPILLTVGNDGALHGHAWWQIQPVVLPTQRTTIPRNHIIEGDDLRMMMLWQFLHLSQTEDGTQETLPFQWWFMLGAELVHLR